MRILKEIISNDVLYMYLDMDGSCWCIEGWNSTTLYLDL